MESIDRSGKGIVLVLSDDDRLIATVTDGDIRRAILAGLDVNLVITELLNSRAQQFQSAPVTAEVGTPDAELLHLMTEQGLRQIPLLDCDGRVANLVML